MNLPAPAPKPESTSDPGNAHFSPCALCTWPKPHTPDPWDSSISQATRLRWPPARQLLLLLRSLSPWLWILSNSTSLCHLDLCSFLSRFLLSQLPPSGAGVLAFQPIPLSVLHPRAWLNLKHKCQGTQSPPNHLSVHPHTLLLWQLFSKCGISYLSLF